MDYNVIFDISNFRYPWFGRNMFEIIIILTIVLFYFLIDKYLEDYIQIRLSFIISFIVVIVLGSCFSNFFSYSAYQSIKNKYLNKQYKVVEGYVENVSVEYSRINKQRFSVQNVNFEISDNITTGGYNTTIIEGGKIRENEFIRLHYIEKVNDERIIAKFEIKK